MQRDKASLYDVITSMRIVMGYVKGRSYTDFSQDPACVDAVVRRLEVIGEAVKRLSLPFRDQSPQIPWQKMAGMRDRLIHGYDDVDLDDVFNTVTKVIPTLIPQLESLFASLPDPT